MALKSRKSTSEASSVVVFSDGLRVLEHDYTPQGSTGETSSEKKGPLPRYSDTESLEAESINASMETVALKALHVDDDPNLNPWTFRVFFLGWSLDYLLAQVYIHVLSVFLGLGLSAFGSALATVFLFKPQSVSVSIIFLTVISYAGGLGMETIIPNKGLMGRWLNPHPFNSKEHLAIVMSVVSPCPQQTISVLQYTALLAPNHHTRTYFCLACRVPLPPQPWLLRFWQPKSYTTTWFPIAL